MDVRDAIEQAYKNGYESGKSKWIPVVERLPKQEGWYLVFTAPDRGYRSINKGYFCKGYDWDNFTPRWSGAGGTWTNVTHWTPLPESPKGE